jgi:hypothetical protein
LEAHVAKADWSAIEALVKHLFDAGLAPDRNDLMELAMQGGADDDIVDAIDTLGPRPLSSLDNLKEQLQGAGVLA